MRKQLFLALMTLIVSSCVWAAPKKAPAKKPLPVWKPAPALLKQLAPPTELPYGTMRLPRVYEVESVKTFNTIGGGIRWSKKQVAGSNEHFLMLAQLPLAEIGASHVTLEQYLKDYTDGMPGDFINWKRTVARQGLINGTRALRTDWSGIDKRTRRKYQGMIIVTRDKEDFYLIHTHHRVDQPVEQRLTEAAALTFKIQNQD